MLDDADREAIVTTTFEMIREEVTKPLTSLIDCLLFELMACDSIDRERLATRLSSIWSSLSEESKDSQGYRLFYRYLYTLESLNSEPEKWIEFLQNAQPNAESGQAMPSWFQGIIDGQAPDSDRES